jgi:DNA polymerase/3'-5' exonuclease PolX
MSSGERVPLAQAREVANELVALLASACISVHIAGSIRRQSETVADVDLVCEPIILTQADLFGEPSGETVDCLHERCDELVEQGILGKRLNKNGLPSWGHSLKRATFKGMNVDVQAVTDSDSWGFWFLVRTGPAAFNKAIVTPRWQGGLLPPGFEVKGGFQLYRGGGRVPTPTERSVFESLGLPWIEPWDRDAHVGEGGR